MAVNEGPFAGIVTPAGAADATAKLAINVELDKLIALIPDGTEGSSPAPHPDFDNVTPEYAVKFIKEIEGMKDAITAMP